MSSSKPKLTKQRIKQVIAKAIKDYGPTAAEKLFGALISSTTGLSVADHRHLDDWSKGQGISLPKPTKKKQSIEKVLTDLHGQHGGSLWGDVWKWVSDKVWPHVKNKLNPTKPNEMTPTPPPARESYKVKHGIVDDHEVKEDVPQPPPLPPLPKSKPPPSLRIPPQPPTPPPYKPRLSDIIRQKPRSPPRTMDFPNSFPVDEESANLIKRAIEREEKYKQYNFPSPTEHTLMQHNLLSEIQKAEQAYHESKSRFNFPDTVPPPPAFTGNYNQSISNRLVRSINDAAAADAGKRHISGDLSGDGVQFKKSSRMKLH